MFVSIERIAKNKYLFYYFNYFIIMQYQENKFLDLLEPD